MARFSERVDHGNIRNTDATHRASSVKYRGLFAKHHEEQAAQIDDDTCK